MATIKKACKGALYPKSSSVSSKLKGGGKVPKTPAQKKFAALAPPKDKITFADKIAGAKGKAKKGAKIKKALMGTSEGPGPKKTVMQKLKMKYPDADTGRAGDVRGTEMYSNAPKPVLQRYNDTYNAFEKKFGNKPATNKKGGVTKKTMKMGGKTKKCAYGCK
jgi:hypothetical protein